MPQRAFHLLSGVDELWTNPFNNGVAKHKFCKVCGIKPFYIPRSNPDGVYVNVNCFHVNCFDERPASLPIVQSDGRNWQLHAHTLVHKSQCVVTYA